VTAAATLVFDGTCGSCRWFARAAKSLDARDRLRLATLQDPEIESRLRPSLGAAYEASFHLIDEKSGRVRSGEGALLELARLLPAVRPFAEVAFALPGVRRLPALAYRAAAAARRCAIPAARRD
jgi:predicted DCC family thiol-disulfide oxidoreductase YuxK